ncbi:hypothetical protein [Clavibacter phaseoli]|uniref:hypothetical protein n=1 Tax=Clavibacter phaseoli TaxID=1734031 RepID=UPI001F475B96|nr:hypothetical protein [Clavibacter phaseoli]UKF32459.1 hypothetical protein FGD69_15085 [Clavibacter phaseoli]UKF38520.1 hypothetical protein FGI33_15265 [Clavibacter phaseoli]
MNLDWLYGPRARPATGPTYEIGRYEFRSAEIDIEAVYEALALVPREGYSGEEKFSVQTPTSFRSFGRKSVGDLGLSDRQNLHAGFYLQKQVPDGEPVREVLSVSIKFDAGKAPSVTVNRNDPTVMGDYGREDQVLAMSIIGTLLKDGRLLIPWWQHARYLIALPVLLVLICWLVLLNSYEFLPAAVVLGWTLLGTFVAGSVAVARYVTRKNRDKWPGMRVRGESRKETHIRRADSRQNVKVATITALITAALAVITGIVIWSVTGSS